MLNIGDKLPNFKLMGYDDMWHDNFEYADKYALLVIFTCNSCPYARAYAQRLIKLFERYEDDNLGIVGINSNCDKKSPEDSLEKMKVTAQRLGLDDLNFMYLRDDTQEVAKEFGASVNPMAFLFNSKRELVYKGAIDDNWESEHLVSRVYLEDAIEYCLDGIEVDFPEVEPAVSCPIIWKD